MLDSIRKRKDNFIYSGIILVTAAVMGFYGVGKFSDDSKGGGVAAWVNGEAISQQDLGQEMERRIYQYQNLFGGQFDPKMLGPDFPRQVLEQLIRAKLLAQQAQKMALTVTDEELADFIRSIPAYQKDGKFDSLRYTQIPNRGLLERGWRERLQLTKFQNYVSGRARLTPSELRQNHLLKETKLELQYARIDFASLGRSQKTSKKDLDEFEKTVSLSELQSYYDSHKADFTEKPKFHLKQIRVGIPYQASDEQRAAAQKKIDSIRGQVNGTNFSEIAKKQSDDEFAKKGGDVGWITQGTLEKPLEEAVERLAPGELSPAVSASFGHFIFQLVERKAGVEKTLGEVRPLIAEKLYQEKFVKDFGESTRKRWDELLTLGKDIQNELKAHGVEIKKTGAFSIGQNEVPGIGNSENILDVAFGLTLEKPLSKTLVFFQDQYYYIKLLRIDPAKEFDLAKNSESIESAWKTRVEDQLVKDWVAQLEKKSNKKIEIKLASSQDPTTVQ